MAHTSLPGLRWPRLLTAILALGLVTLSARCLKTLDDAVCGNGVMEAGEECDCGSGASPYPASCAGPNRDTGTATCRSDCSLPFCGDDILDVGRDEACDGASFGLATCQSLGYTSGTLTCDASCLVSAEDCR